VSGSGPVGVGIVLDVMIALDTAAETGGWQTVDSTVTRPRALPEDWDPSEATL